MDIELSPMKFTLAIAGIISGLTFAEARATWMRPLVASKGTSTADPGNPGVIGHTYITSSSAVIESQYRCGEIVADIANFLFDQKNFEEQLVYDYVFACIPAGTGESFVAIDLTIEAARDSAVAFLNDYIRERQGQHVHKQLIDFKKITNIQTEKSFSAEYFELGQNQPSHSYSQASAKLNHFPNFAQYKNHIASEVAVFYRSPTIESVVHYIGGYLSATELELFKNNGMMKSNHLSTSNRRKMHLDDGDFLPGFYGEGAFRNCLDFASRYCLE